MSILIKGMEMPKSCIWREGKCPLLGDDDDCKLQDCQEDWTWEDQYKGCPLSEAPEPCDGAVSRKDVIDLYKRGADRIAKAKGISVEDMPHNGLDALMNLPPVTPKRKTGKWIHSDFSHEFLQCSECGRGRYFCSNFCPNCGADMRSEAEQEVK